MTTILHQIKIISINDTAKRWNLKNKKLQQKFKKSCTAKTTKAFFLKSLLGACSIRYSEIPINRYNTVQTGPNMALGGLKKGLTSVTYQLFTPEAVAMPPIAPIDKQASRHNTN